MEVYLQVFVNFKQNDWARFLPMIEFTYNNIKNVSIGHTLFKLNYVYHLLMLYKGNVNSRSKSKSTDELLAELKKLIIVYQKNFYYTQELQKWAHDKGVKSQSYAFGKKVWLNNKYIKINRYRKLEGRFFETFRLLYLIIKQAYKLEFPKN